jgi:hypothetical protein
MYRPGAARRAGERPVRSARRSRPGSTTSSACCLAAQAAPDCHRAGEHPRCDTTINIVQQLEPKVDAFAKTLPAGYAITNAAGEVKTTHQLGSEIIRGI